MSDKRPFGDKEKKHRGNRGGVKKRMAMAAAASGGSGPMRTFPRPPFLSGANSVPYGAPVRPPFPGGPPAPPGGRYGFFDGPINRSGPPGYEKRTDAKLRPPGVLEGPIKSQPIPPLMSSKQNDFPQRDGFSESRVGFSDQRAVPLEMNIDRNGVKLSVSDRNGGAPNPTDSKELQTSGENTSEGMNELFAKMVWKKLDLIKDPVRLSRLHIEIMNILQMAIAEETPKK